ncbi:MAG: tetratricopeptide repeat protein [Acidobacteria bacterium]|nr:tetratricopeptide repeat protein [Acidobacteriota bacterium]MBI3662969.1 tetratricopeptide repeat protein [Acidobacteriota bacterium]
MRNQEQYQQGVQLFHAGQIEEAARLIGEAIQAEESTERWNDWATVQVAREQIAEAEHGYRRALEMSPTNAQAAANLGVILVSQGRKAEALLYLAQGAAGLNEPERSTIARLLEECRAEQPITAANTGVSGPAAIRPTTALDLFILKTLREHAEAIHIITTRLLALQEQAEKAAPQTIVAPRTVVAARSTSRMLSRHAKSGK